MKAQWIWTQKEAEPDEYAEFYLDFDYAEGGCSLRFCADSMVTVSLNGDMAAFGKYPDYPHYRVEDTVELTGLRKGRNRLAFEVWYIGVSCSTYRRGEAGLWFELSVGGRVAAVSGTEVLARTSRAYVSHGRPMITPQLGYGFRYDAEKEDGWKEPGTDFPGFAAAKTKALPADFHPRPIRRLELGRLLRGAAVQQGTFCEESYPTAGERMQRAALRYMPPEEMISREADGALRFCGGRDGGVYIIFDLGREEAGFVSLDFSVSEPCEVEIGYGEHLEDGRVRTHIGPRSFTVQYRAKAGENRYVNYFRRLGCRYLEVFFHTAEVCVRGIGLLPVYYPVVRRPVVFSNTLHQKIYDVCVRTLELCMHDHYEDTPWREQSFYTMDSRTQMLCGYIAFEEHAFARAGLALFAQGVREDGQMPLCAPSGKETDYPIPFFSLMYIAAVYEYCKHTGDLSLGEEVYGVLCGILSAFLPRIGANGVLENFHSPQYWDFYEWTDGMDGSEKTASYDAPLNGFFLYAAEKFARLGELLGRKDAERFAVAAEGIRAACRKVFYLPRRGLFKTFEGRPEHLSELANSLFVLTGVAGDRAAAVCEKLAEKDNGMVKISLSHAIFKYEALLSFDREKYAPLIVREIEDRYLGMLCRGATSFWETDLGAEDFGRAGSLSHGWSAVPVYIFQWLGLCDASPRQNKEVDLGK